MTKSAESSRYDEFRYAPVLTLTDVFEAAKIAHALMESGLSACAVGGDVVVAWEGLSAADDIVAALRCHRTDIDWAKVRVNWAKRTSLPTDK